MKNTPSVFDVLSRLMKRTIAEAKKVSLLGEVPVAAMIVDDQMNVLSLKGNGMRSLCDPTAHAELLAIRDACLKRGLPRLENHTMVVSLEPCAMCAAAIAQARIKRLVFGAYDRRAGAVTHGIKFFDNDRNYGEVEIISGVLEEESSMLLTKFFADLRRE